jgi:hypothetical protein
LQSRQALLVLGYSCLRLYMPYFLAPPNKFEADALNRTTSDSDLNFSQTPFLIVDTRIFLLKFFLKAGVLSFDPKYNILNGNQ